MRFSDFRQSFGMWTIVAAVAAAPSTAATPAKQKPAPPPVQVAPKAGKSLPNFEAMMGFVDKLFPPQPDPDPARLALARTSVQSMWPDGAYGKMMIGLMGGMIDHAMQLKKSDLAGLGGNSAVPAAGAKDVSLHDEIAAKDPYFDQRLAAIRGAVDEEMAKASTIVDPRMREGMARAMARRLDGPQLADINRFFATPSGHAFAGQYMQLWIDPDTMRSIFSSMPAMMKLMPDMMQKIKAANDKFPPPPKPAKPDGKDAKPAAASPKG